MAERASHRISHCSSDNDSTLRPCLPAADGLLHPAEQHQLIALPLQSLQQQRPRTQSERRLQQLLLRQLPATSLRQQHCSHVMAPLLCCACARPLKPGLVC